MILDLPPPKKLRLSVDEDEFEEWKYQLKTFLSQSPENLMFSKHGIYSTWNPSASTEVRITQIHNRDKNRPNWFFWLTFWRLFWCRNDIERLLEERNRQLNIMICKITENVEENVTVKQFLRNSSTSVSDIFDKLQAMMIGYKLNINETHNSSLNSEIFHRTNYTALDQDEAVESFLESGKKRDIQANSRVTRGKQKVESKSSTSSNNNSFPKSEGYQSHPESSDEEDKKQTKQKKQIPRRRSYAFMKSRFRDRSEIKADDESEDKAEVKSKVPVGEVIELIAKELPNSPTFQSQGKKDILPLKIFN